MLDHADQLERELEHLRRLWLAAESEHEGISILDEMAIVRLELEALEPAEDPHLEPTQTDEQYELFTSNTDTAK
jgi:hypothetical protein